MDCQIDTERGADVCAGPILELVQGHDVLIISQEVPELETRFRLFAVNEKIDIPSYRQVVDVVTLTDGYVIGKESQECAHPVLSRGDLGCKSLGCNTSRDKGILRNIDAEDIRVRIPVIVYPVLTKQKVLRVA